VNAPAALAMKVSLVSVPDPSRVTAVGTVSFGALGDAVQTRTLTFTGAGEDPLVLKVETTATDASGKVVAGRFEEYVNGTYQWGENLQTDMATPVYRGQRTRQKLSLHKPTPLKLKYMPCTQIWYAEGLLDDGFNVATAVHMTQQDTTPEGGRTRRDRAFTCFSSNWLTRLSSFPYDYDKLLSYDMIVLGGVKAEALGLIGQEMLCDFLTAGGGMIVLGGPAAYGPSRLRGTPLADMLPVTIAPTPFDLAKLRDATVKPVAPDTPFLEALDWSDAPRVRYVHKVGVKPWGKVVLEAGGHPFLVVGEVGPRKARVACIMGVPMGSFAENATPFWEWADWTYLLRQLNWWVMKENHRFKPDVW